MRTLLPLAGLAGEAIALGAKYFPLPPRVSLIRVQRTKHRDAQPYLVLLRRVAAVRAEIAKGKTSRAARNELETILVVDDDPIILKIVISILKRANFKILSADCAETALKLAEKKVDRINLLLSDVEMPGLSGPDLGEALKKFRPDVHVMFMSGGRLGICWFLITAGSIYRSHLCPLS